MRRIRRAVVLILRQNSGDYSGAGQNTAELSEIAEVFCFRIVGLSARFRTGRTVRVRYSVQIRTNSKSPLLCTNKDGNSETFLTRNSEHTVSSSLANHFIEYRYHTCKYKFTRDIKYK